MAGFEVRSGILRLRFWGRLLCYFLPLFFGLGALCWELARQHFESAVAAAEASSVLQVTQGHRLILTHTASVFSDLLLTAYSPAVHGWAEDPANDAAAKQLLVALAGEKPGYDQIRLLDLDGNERIRVNRKGAAVELVAESNLQNKAHRYYFQEAKALEPGQVFVSRIDLNVEFGQVVEPFEPTVRFATQVTNLDGTVFGILLINFRVDALLSQLAQLSENFDGEIQLLDRDGYWLMCKNPQNEWGFMLPSGESLRLANAVPKLWRDISGAAMGSVNVPQGYAHWQRIQVVDYRGYQVEGVRKPLELVVLGLIDTERLAVIRRESQEPYLLYFAVSATILLVGCICMTIYHDRLPHGETCGALLSRALEEAPWGAMVVSQNGDVLWISGPLSRYLGYRADELAGSVCDQVILIKSPEAFLTAIRAAIMADGKWQGELHLKSSKDVQSVARAVVSSVQNPEGESATAYFIVFPDLST